MYHMINSKEDIEQFLKETNWLHDGYIIHVDYSHNGITKLEHGHYFEPEKTKLTIQILVTSIWDAVVEIEFECLKEWQIRDHQWDIGETSVFFDENDREVLTMIRAGEMNAAFRFDKRDPRQLCTYETPIMPIEFTVNTRTVRNGLEETGGVLLLDYYLEMRGVNTERNRLLIEVQPL